MKKMFLIWVNKIIILGYNRLIGTFNALPSDSFVVNNTLLTEFQKFTDLFIACGATAITIHSAAINRLAAFNLLYLQRILFSKYNNHVYFMESSRFLWFCWFNWITHAIDNVT